jgi:signal transduction histidine kinase
LALLLQTVILYFAVLLPLLLIARRIAAPLIDLKQRVQSIGGNTDFEPMVPAGPDDVRNLIGAFNTMQVRVASLLSEKDVMLGAIGHDLKTPLASLRVRIESVDDDDEREKMASTVEEMTQMLDDILTLARNGKSGEAMQRTEIVALVESATLDFIDVGHPVKFVETDTRIIAPVRPILLRRAIRNLIDNAVQHGGNALVSVKSVDGNVQISIDDNGPGIPVEQSKKLFEPFARSEQSRGRATGGSGLGLTIARAIARNHNGDVVLQNRATDGGAPSGLTAIIRFPLE